ncbi:MAG: SCF ubiquitin ligase complex subunit [Peltula sp. TS41687]|nr:MAG: SCF ubiquitin ligase complex subunit [Peltula sp. TS41687]
MPRFPSCQRPSSGDDPASESSSASSPDRAEFDDNDFFMLQANDSQSSIGASTFRDMAVSPARDRERYRSPISRLPPEILITIFSKLGSTAELRTCMLVSKRWAKNSVDLLWQRPLCNNWKNLLNVVHSVRKAHAYFAYYDLVKRLNLTSLAADVSDGTIMPLAVCKRVERLTLTQCTKLTDTGVKALLEGNRNLLALDFAGLEHITDYTLLAVADNCSRLQGLNISACKLVTDKSLCALSENCKALKRMKLNECSQLTSASITSLAKNCRQMLEIDLHNCKLTNDAAVTALLTHGMHLRELRLGYCKLITDEAFLAVPKDRIVDTLRILDLTACDLLTDSAVAKIISCAPRLRNLVLAKSDRITDHAVRSISKLGKNLHYVHLGHCAHITDNAVIDLVKACNRIRYIDLACCHRLTDASVIHLATLPKLRRIGLVKCQAITDRSILALARAKPGGAHGSQLVYSSLERVHLSYCVHLTLRGIHVLLSHCPRLTHLSVTGVQAFLRADITVFCREAPTEFNDHQRDLFCVFSGLGVRGLREHLANRANSENFMYGEGDDPAEDTQQVAGLMHATALNVNNDEIDEEFAEDSEVGGEEQG